MPIKRSVSSALLLCFLFTLPVYAAGEASPPKPSPTNSRGGAAAVAVVTEKVAAKPLSQTLQLVGKLTSHQSVDIAADVTAKIIKLNVAPNDRVKRGDLLIELNGAEQKAGLDEAQSYLNDEKRKLGEYEKLVKRGAITKTEIDAQRAVVEIAKAKLDGAQAQWQRYQIRAPFAGTTGLFNLSVGQLVSNGSALLTLDDLSTMNLDLLVPEHYLSQLSVGMPVTANATAWANNTFSGKVTAIDTRIDTDTLSVKIRVTLANSEGLLSPGMLLSAHIVFPEVTKPLIPVQSLQYAGTKRFVYRVKDDNRVERTLVELGARQGNEVFIEKGLNIGDEIVVQGIINMRDGVAVERVDELGRPLSNKTKGQ